MNHLAALLSQPVRLSTSLAHHCYLSFKYHGIRGMVIGALAGIAKPLPVALPFRKWCRRFQDRAFDRRFNVDTAASVAAEDLDIGDDRRKDAVEYAATSPVTFCKIISNLGINYPKYTFIDLGSGKGRVLLLASQFPFREVIGVELAPSLHAIAAQNIAAFTKHTNSRTYVYSICEDVTAFVPPPGPTVFFLYNPFHGMVLESVLQNLQESYKQSPRPMLIVYHNPVHRDSFDKLPCLSSVKSSDQAWALYKFV